MAVPDDVQITFASTAEAIAELPAWSADSRPGIVLTADVATMAALHDAAPALVRRINLGGLHHRPGRVERLRYIYLTDADTTLLRRLGQEGAEIAAQDLPTATAVGLTALLG
jgi:mannose/fructose/N-acetylgalactosamine-specific phosphotransferase system component IIB